MKIIDIQSSAFNERLEEIFTRRSRVFSKYRDEAERLIAAYRTRGEDFLLESAKDFDGVELEKDQLFVDPDQIKNAHKLIPENLRDSIDQTLMRLERFQTELKANSFQTQDEAGIYWGIEVRPISRVGLYVPAGQLVSLMISGVQARVAGVEDLVLATPPIKGLGAPYIDPSVLYLAKVFEVNKVLLAGGVGAMAAFAYGTGSTLPVEKIVGPTGKLAMVAKHCLFGVVGIDGVTGPTEVAFICNSTTSYKSVAADIVSLAEKNPEAEVFLMHPDERWMQKLIEELISLNQSVKTSEAELIRDCLESNTHFFLVNDLDAAFDLCNRIAPGRLCLPIKNASEYIDRIKNVGNLLLGHFTPPAAFDLFGGAGGIVPTLGAAVYSSMSSPQSFVRQFGMVEIQREALDRLKTKSLDLAKAENLKVYKHLFESRLNQ